MEREAARILIKDGLPVDAFLRDKVTFELVSWDDPHATAAMPANLTPQEAINRGMPQPRDCDIVLVIFWARLGTPLPSEYVKPNGERYLSGTEWEYEDAIAAARMLGRPIVLLYRRSEKLKVAIDDPTFEEKRSQFQLIELFFKRLRNPDGSLGGSFHLYETASDFADLLRKTLTHAIAGLLKPARQLASVGSAPAFQSRIEAFFDEYLKAETGPVPFGGRGSELAALDTWLDDPQAPPRCLVTAPAGRGKSALLVRWAERLQQRGLLQAPGAIVLDGWNLVFVPISIRFGTNAQEVFYHALADR